MSKEDSLKDLSNTIKEFISDVRDNIATDSTEKGNLLQVEFFFNKMDYGTIMDYAIQHILPYEKKIKKRKLSFFVKNKEKIFGGLPMEEINKLSKKITEEISEEDQNVIWSYFDVIISIVEDYKKDV